MALRPCLRSTPRRQAAVVLLAAAALIGASPRDGLAIKWPSGCPDSRPAPVRAASRLFVSSPFVHPGHEIGFFLDERQAQRRGFSVEPDGNTVQIVFRPLGGGRRVVLPPFSVRACRCRPARST